MIQFDVRPVTTLRDDHDYVLNRLPQRRWLKKSNFTDDTWVLETQDPDTMRVTKHTITFDAVLTPAPLSKRLNDPGFEHDLLTAKLYVFYSLEPAPIGWNKTASSTVSDYRKLVIFLQWRHDRGVPSNQALTSHWHREFVGSLKDNAREGLLRFTSRVENLISMHEAGQITLPLKTGKRIASPRAIAEMLGTDNARSLTPQSRKVLDAFLLRAGVAGRAVLGRLNREVVDDDPDAKPTANNIYQMLFVWWALWKLRDKLAHDPIQYQAYRSSNDIYRSIRKWTKRSDPYPDPPAYQASWLINSALTLILDDAAENLIAFASAYAEHRTDKALAELEKANRALHNLGYPKISLNVTDRVRGDRNGPRFLTYEILVAACVVVIAAFTARRKNEIYALKVGCIELDPHGAVWLHSLILKNMKEVDRVPVPKSVQVAVSLLERLRKIGHQPDDEWLLQFRCAFTGQALDVDIGLCLTSFSEWCATPALSNGKKWNFSAHQLRKFFGITYFWRYMFPNLAALSLHYRHFNPETTFGYIASKSRSTIKLWDERQAGERRRSATERATAERLAVVESSKLQFTKDVLHSVASGAKLSGSLGQAITREIDLLKKRFAPDVHITGAGNAPSAFRTALADIAERTKLQVHPEGHSICGLGRDASANSFSSCLRLKSQITGRPAAAFEGPDFAFADEEGCLVCPHRASLPVLDPFWDQEMASAFSALRAAKDEQLLLVGGRLDLLQTHLGI
ncbi:hypothetical protein [Rhizobium leguminosarum]|uniref:hypothetical protein n=1 Tax=Rhizobium leguminosarum TaxID=384 RepID=UPI0010315E82|nr:hypothetical protein [Rhizobium leguminosarum]TAV92041.1 hypothetical protein ELI22_23615 [Rhizobium leguminosarum]TAV96649.1 hypothetical protein ELI21_23770 [Rhizobium leguminosarum]TAW37726.1 hypothetical protein ELI23_23820 [Rhizobium leguminosarum]